MLEFLSKLPVKHRKGWSRIRSLLTGLPPIILAFVAYTYENPAVGELGKAAFAHSYPRIFGILLFGALLISFVFDWLEYWMELYRGRTTNSAANLSAAATSISYIVDEKSKRFGQFCAKAVRHPMNRAETFSSITRPEIQITELVKFLTLTVKELTDEPALKLKTVFLSLDESGNFGDAICFPASQTPDNELLKPSCESFFKEVSQKRNPRFISDLRKHQRSRKRKKVPYFHKPANEPAVGSIIGYSIHHRQLERVVGVLTIKSDKPNVFDGQFVKKHGEYIQWFLDRLCLELSLKIIKQTAELHEAQTPRKPNEPPTP